MEKKDLSPKRKQMGMKRYQRILLAWQMACMLLLMALPSWSWAQVIPSLDVVATPPRNPGKGYRTGELITITGVNLNGTCAGDSLEIRWTGAPAPGFVRMSYNATISNTNFSTATITGGSSLTFRLPTGIPCGNKLIRYSRLNASCAAPRGVDTLTLPFPTLDSASLDYPRDSFCVGDLQTLPVQLDPVLVTALSPSSLIVDPFSGDFFSHSGVVGPHTIRAIANQDPNDSTVAWCRDTSEFLITILGPGAPQSMAYGSGIGPYCPETPAHVFVPLASYPGSISGLFTSSPIGLDLDSTIGAIRTDLSTPGTYQVTYTPPYAECAAPISVFVVVEPVQETRFQYLSPICSGASGLAPAISSYVPGVFSVAAIPGASGVVTVDTTTGVVNAAGANFGYFKVRFTPSGTGTCSDTSTAIVTVLPKPNVAFTFAGNVDSVCSTSAPLQMNITNPLGGGGTFYDFSGGLQFDQGNNTIILTASTPGGPYMVTHIDSIVSGSTVCIDSFSLPITVVSSANAFLSYPVDTFCFGTVDTVFPAFLSGAVGGYFSGPTSAGSPGLDPNTGRVTITSTTAPGTYAYTYHYATSAICTAGSSTQFGSITVLAVPLADIRFVDAPGQDNYSVCSNELGVGLQRFVTPTNPISIYTETLEIFGGAINSPIALPDDSVIVAAMGVGGPYPIVFETTVGSCTNSDTIYLTVRQFFSSAFDYLDSVACQGGSNPVPYIIGQGGGRFRNITPQPSPPISLDVVTGEIDISNISNVTGTNLAVEYSTFILDSVCSDISTDTITLIGNNSADFEYGGVRFCKSDGDTLIPTFNGLPLTTANFTWMALDSLDTLTISQAGLINVNASETGTYTISNSISGGGCVAQFTLSITILPGFVTTTMNYDSLSYCAGQPNPTPVLTGDSTGVFISTSGINLLDNLGTIDLSNSVPRAGQPYIITYRLENSDGCSVIVTDSIEILPLGGSNIEYVPGFICSTDDFFYLDTIPTKPGIFTLETETGQFLPNAIDSLTGTITIDSLGNNYNVQFEVLFTPLANACAEPDVQILQFQRGPDSASVTPFPDTTICAGQTVRILALGILDGAFFALNGDSIVPTWEFIGSQVSSSQWADYDVVDVVLFTGASALIHNNFIGGVRDSSRAILDTANMCFIRRRVSFNVIPLPNVVLDANQVDVVTTDQQINFNFTSDTDNTVVNWSAEDLNPISPNAIFNPDSGQVTSGFAGVPFAIPTSVGLMKRNSPAQVIYTFRPNALGCEGEIIVDTLNINPENVNVFVPEIFTPDGDEFNPTWLIQVKSGVDPAAYTLVLYNRAGGVVFEMSPLVDTWDGGSLPDGVYWWNLLDSGGNSVDRGGLTIRRK